MNNKTKKAILALVAVAVLAVSCTKIHQARLEAEQRGELAAAIARDRMDWEAMQKADRESKGMVNATEIFNKANKGVK